MRWAARQQYASPASPRTMAKNAAGTAGALDLRNIVIAESS
jgi:hypothetical protein